jgi:hypothetical protein
MITVFKNDVKLKTISDNRFCGLKQKYFVDLPEQI